MREKRRSIHLGDDVRNRYTRIQSLLMEEGNPARWNAADEQTIDLAARTQSCCDDETCAFGGGLTTCWQCQTKSWLSMPPSNSSFASKFGLDSAAPYAGEQIRPDLGQYRKQQRYPWHKQIDMIKTIYSRVTESNGKSDLPQVRQISEARELSRFRIQSRD